MYSVQTGPGLTNMHMPVYFVIVMSCRICYVAYTDKLYIYNTLKANEWDLSDLLHLSLGLGQDGQDEGGRLIGLVGGRHNQVFTRLQRDELHHFTCVQVGFSLGHNFVSAEERGWEPPFVCLVL